MGYYVHDLPGRLRIMTPLMKNNNKAACAVEGLLLAIGGVASVAVNTRTGSCLVNYDPERAKRDEILSVLVRMGYFDPSKAITNDQYIDEAARKVLMLIASFI
jgi:copper chaperone CopZ